MIDGKFIGDGFDVFPEQTVIIEGTDQVFHDVLLDRTEVDFSHLFLQFVIERDGISIYNLLIVGIRVVLVAVRQWHLVVASNVFQSIVERVSPFLPFILFLKSLFPVLHPFIPVFTHHIIG